MLGSLIAVLLVLAAVERNPGNLQDAIFVGGAVLANVAVGTFQEIRAARTLRGIVAFSAPRVTVVRDGSEDTVPSQEVVPGDFIQLRSGD